MRLPGGHSAKEPVPENSVPLGGSVIPPKPGTIVHRSSPDTDCPIEPLKPQPWRVDTKQVTQSITRDNQGRWILAAEANNGFRWEVDASEAVQAAATHLRCEEMAAQAARIQELEEENALARDWLGQYYEKYGDPDS